MEAAGDGRPTVVATTTQLADFARAVAGERARIVGLLRPNIDPHDFEPTPADVAEIARASVVLVNGLGLDDWASRLIETAGGDPLVVVASKGLPVLRESDGAPDPHVWLDPRNAAAMTRNVAEGLARADPAGAADYRAAARRYAKRLDALDRRLRRRIGTVPPAERLMVTDHDAFGYLADRYGIRVVGTLIPSLSSAAEPSARELTRLAATIRREGVQTIFTERSVDPRLARALAAETGARVEAGLYGDSLGPADSPGATYEGMMEADMARIVAGMRAG
jgi:zinc/manganese transport system substrate-binding protein/manganese/iron transport system substrate-binding protein